jgi:hypothetical protein
LRIKKTTVKSSDQLIDLQQIQGGQQMTSKKSAGDPDPSTRDIRDIRGYISSDFDNDPEAAQTLLHS